MLYEKYNESPLSVVFLHGYSFTGYTWKEIGVLDLLEKKKITYASPDMPYGRTTECTKHTRSLELNLTLLEHIVEMIIKPDKLILVGASLGGKIALHYALRHNIDGLLLLAPYIVGDDEILKNAERIPGKILVIAGENDNIVSYDILKEFAEKTGAELITYEGSGHAMYLEHPERFNRDLENFLNKLL